MKKKLVVSTGNKNKIREIEYILRNMDLEILSKGDLGYADLDVLEDANTLEENSYKKAEALFNELGNHMVMADDSGLFVDVLGGDPGVHSSRYAGDDGNDEKNNKKLLQELDGVGKSDRTGRFKTVITLITCGKKVYKIEGVCKGRIAFEPKGSNGFGYDPLFIPNGYNQTFGELPANVKNRISHRYRALLALKELLEEIL